MLHWSSMFLILYKSFLSHDQFKVLVPYIIKTRFNKCLTNQQDTTHLLWLLKYPDAVSYIEIRQTQNNVLVAKSRQSANRTNPSYSYHHKFSNILHGVAYQLMLWHCWSIALCNLTKSSIQFTKLYIGFLTHMACQVIRISSQGQQSIVQDNWIWFSSFLKSCLKFHFPYPVLPSSQF